MALSDSKLLIRDYENIRHILRDVYIYGCFSRDDFVDKGISGRKYDNEQRRITAYLPKHFVQKRREKKKVVLFCSYNKEDSFSNKLAETYRNKSFTVFDILSYFYILYILSIEPKATATEILDNMPNCNDEYTFTSATLRNKLDELENVGLISSSKMEGSIFYSLSDDVWKEFSDDELIDIYTYVSFVRNTSLVEVPYFYLQQKLKLYMKVQRHCDPEKLKPIFFEHNHLFNVLDNCILVEILSAINKKKYMHLDVRTVEGSYETDILPVEVIYDCLYGRQFLLCMELKNNKIMIIRIDRIISASITTSIREDDEIYIMSLKKMSDKCWSVSGINQSLTRVVIDFYIKDSETFVLRRLYREKQEGTVSQIAPDIYRYEIDVSDPGEMIPWIRSFGERAKVVSSGEFDLITKLRDDWKKAVEKYESFS